MCVRILRRDGREDRHRRELRDHGRDRSALDRQGRPARPRIRRTADHAGRRARRDQQGEEQPADPPIEYESKTTSFFGERSRHVYREYDRRLAREQRPRLRRPDLAARSVCSRATSRRARVIRTSSATCSSTNTRTSTTRSTGSCAILAARAQEYHRRRRRRSVDLLVARQRLQEHPPVRTRLPRREGLQTRGELSQHPDDPYRRERTGREQHDARRRRRSSRNVRPANRHGLRRRNRARRSALRHREDQGTRRARAAPIATSWSSTARTRNRASSKRASSARGSRIASSAASVSTRGPRSRT